MADVLEQFASPAGSVALGSVKSNIGHLKGAAGAAGLLKATLALRDKVLPPSLNCEHPNPAIDFAHSPLYVNTELRPWTVPADVTRRVGLSAFGFGGTNFHAVLEEYIPGKLNGNGKHSVAVSAPSPVVAEQTVSVAAVVPVPTVASLSPSAVSSKAPLSGALVIGADSDVALAERLQAVQQDAAAGRAPAPSAPAESDLRAPERLAIDYADAADLADKSTKALKALKANQPPIWKALRPQGIFRGSGPAGKVAFLYTGQGSQYVNMLAPLRAAEPIVAETFAEADRIMTPLLGKPLSEFVFVDQTNPRRRCESGRRSAPDRNHSAHGADDRPRPDPAAGRLRHPARHDHGTQPGRIRRAGCVGLAHLRGRVVGRQRPRPGHDESGRERYRQDGGGICAAC